MHGAGVVCPKNNPFAMEPTREPISYLLFTKPKNPVIIICAAANTPKTNPYVMVHTVNWSKIKPPFPSIKRKLKVLYLSSQN